jgi:hypothetical protein
VQEISTIPRLPLDPNKIRQLLTQDHHCNPERVNRYITKLQEYYAKYYKNEVVEPSPNEIPTNQSENHQKGSSPFTQAILLPDDAERKPFKSRKRQANTAPKILNKVLDLGEPQIPATEDLRPFSQIDDHYRLEVQMTPEEKVVYYVKRNQPFAEWPIEVQMHFRTVIGILYGLHLIPKEVYQEKYVPLWQQSPVLNDALENFLRFSTETRGMHD